MGHKADFRNRRADFTPQRENICFQFFWVVPAAGDAAFTSSNLRPLAGLKHKDII